MYIIASFDCKFKTNHDNIESMLQHYGLRKIQSSLYVGNLDNDERKNLYKNISDVIRENDSVLIVALCQSCYSKKEVLGREIKFKEDFYRVY